MKMELLREVYFTLLIETLTDRTLANIDGIDFIITNP